MLGSIIVALATPGIADAQMTAHDSSSIVRSVAALVLGRIQPQQRDSVAVLAATGDAILNEHLATELAGLRHQPTVRVRADSQKNWGVYRAAWSLDSARLVGDRPIAYVTMLTTSGSGATPACLQFFRVGDAVALVRNGAEWRVSSFRTISVNTGMCAPSM